MLIIKTEEDRERCTSCYGNHTIGDPNFNEYGVFIRLEGNT